MTRTREGLVELLQEILRERITTRDIIDRLPHDPADDFFGEMDTLLWFLVEMEPGCRVPRLTPEDRAILGRCLAFAQTSHPYVADDPSYDTRAGWRKRLSPFRFRADPRRDPWPFACDQVTWRPDGTWVPRPR